jgi:hypothetical protein
VRAVLTREAGTHFDEACVAASSGDLLDEIASGALAPAPRLVA